MSAQPPPSPPESGAEGQARAAPTPPVFQPVVMAAGGRLRRALNNSSARQLGLFVMAVTGAWWWLDGGKRAMPPDVRSTAPTRAEVKPDELPPKPATPAPVQAAALPDAAPRPTPIAAPTPLRPAQPPGPPPALVSSKGQVRAAPPPASTLRPAAYAPPEPPPDALGRNEGSARGGVAYKAPTIPGFEVIAIGDLERTLIPGTDIPCTLSNAIDGTHPGDFTCIVGKDISGGGFPPRVTLLPAGVNITGTYRPLAAGEQRILGLSAYATVTVGDKLLYVPLGGAPVEDSLGRTGMDGYVESRFWERLGNAIITDIGGAAARLPASAMQSTAAGLQVSTNTTETIVQDTLRTQANTVRPLFRKNQGDTINIRITMPVHFGALRYEAAR